MSRRVLILVEGQTEERFVKDLLAPALLPKEIYLIPTLLVTKRVQSGGHFKGGVTRYARCRADLERLLRGAGGDGCVTTLLDYYGLPDDFPGMATRLSLSTPGDKVKHVENAICQDLGNPGNLIPFLALHEFEAWIYASPSELPGVMHALPKQAADFAGNCAAHPSPEDINEHPQTAPSKRILQLFPGYRKTVHGPLAAARIGLDEIWRACPHLDAWVTRLEGL